MFQQILDPQIHPLIVGDEGHDLSEPSQNKLHCLCAALLQLVVSVIYTLKKKISLNIITLVINHEIFNNSNIFYRMSIA